MKKYKGFAAVLACAMLAQTAYAEKWVEFYENTAQGNAAFIITGSADSENEEINVLILKPGKSLETNEAVTDGNYIKYAASLLTSESGGFKVSVPLSAEDEEGEYTCYVGGAAFEKQAVTKTSYHSSEFSAKEAIKELKKAVSPEDLAGKITKKIKMDLSIDNTLVNGIDVNAFAKLIYADMSILNEDNSAKTILDLQKTALLAAYNEGKKELVQKDNEFLYTEFIDFAGLDKDGVTLYDGYEKILSSDAKLKVIDALLKKDFKNTDELYKAFAQEVLLKGIKGAVTKGTGHIGNLLTAENAKKAGISVSEYTSLETNAEKTKANNKIFEAAFSNATELESAVKKAAKAAKEAENGGNGGGTGGGSSSKNNDSYSVNMGGYSNTNIPGNTETNAIFNDIAGVAWAAEAIEALYEKGIVNGVGEGNFAPDEEVTREQFAVMLMRAFNIVAEGEENCFIDADEGAYYTKYINMAKKLGIVKGMEENVFGVGSKLKRQDLAVMAKNTADYCGINIAEITEAKFDDENLISDYAVAAVKSLANAKIINGYEDNTFRPHEYCTRAQAAKIIYELLKGGNQ